MNAISEDNVQVCQRLTSRITADMADMRESTEDAALNIGNLLVEIVKIATEGNAETKQTLCQFVRSDACSQQQSATISETIDRQTDLFRGLIEEIRGFFDRQLALSQAANSATRKIFDTANQITQLMRSSRILALNLRIESARLGSDGSTFAILGDQMKVFSDNVAEANGVIASSVEEFVTEMPKLEEEARAMGENLSEFSSRFDDDMAEVKVQTESFQGLVNGVLETTERRNNQILECSNATLSHLQFQDPVSQGLRRAEHDVEKLLTLFEGRELDDRSLADIADEVGHDGRNEVESGDVMLF